jgi:hypothetical protein
MAAKSSKNKTVRAEVLIPKYYEFEQMRRSINRKYLPAVIISLFLALVSMGIAFLAFARPIPVVVFDSAGKPILFEDTATPRMTMDDIRVTWFTKEFIKKWVGVDSARIDEDLHESLAMMTPVFRGIVIKEDAEVEKRAQYKNANLRALFDDWDVRIGKYDPEDFEGKIHTLVTGRMVFEPRFGQVEPGPDGEVNIQSWFLAEVIVQRTPVRTNSVHGMLVRYAHTTMFDTRKSSPPTSTERHRGHDARNCRGHDVRTDDRCHGLQIR